MTVFRTAYPGDSFTVQLSDSTLVTVGYGGADIPDGFTLEVRAAATAAGVTLVEGGPVVAPAAPLTQRVSTLEQTVAGLPAPLVEQPQVTVGPPWPVARSGQMVPVSLAGATSSRTLTLEPGSGGSRLAIRLDVAEPGFVLQFAGSGSDVVPAVSLATAGSVVVLEGMTGGGGWRVVSLYTGGAVAWSQVTGTPAIPSQLTDLGGTLSDAQIPAAITRDTELTAGLATKSDTSHTHSTAATHTHDNPVVEARLTADVTGIANNQYFGLRTNATAFTDNWAMFGGGSGNLYTLTVPATWAGRWRVSWSAYTNAAAGTNVLAILFLNAAPTTPDASLATYTCGRLSALGGAPASVTQSMVLAVGDTISVGIYVFQTGGTSNLYALLPSTSYARSKVVAEWTGPR